MAFKIAVFFTILAAVNAGYLSPALHAAPVAAYAPAHYSDATAVSHSYISQATPAVYAHAAPAVYASAVPAGYAHPAPAVYAHAAPVAVHAPAVGATHQSVLRSLGGNQAVSHYSKAVDSAFSSVRKYDTRITNDALTVAHAPVATYAAPYATYAAHAPVATYAAHAPVATYAAHAPLATYAAHAPVLKSAVAYSPAAVVSHATFEGIGAHYAW